MRNVQSAPYGSISNRKLGGSTLPHGESKLADAWSTTVSWCGSWCELDKNHAPGGPWCEV
jgi:hypothetical protein